MLSFWPSLSVFGFSLAVFFECRLLAGRATISLRGLVSYVLFGAIGASLIAILLEQIPFLSFGFMAPVRSALIAQAVSLFGPVSEEFAKALPVILIAFVTGAWRRLSLADLVLIGAATGAGFGFAEANLNGVVNGTLPQFQHLLGFGYASAGTGADAVYFAGHALTPAFFGLAAGIGLRLYPIRSFLAWIPAAAIFVLVCFDHGMFNWKLAHPAAGGGFEQAPQILELLYLATFHGRLELGLFPLLLLAAQFLEGRLCASFIGRRADLLLPGERRIAVLNEWRVALLRLRYGRAAVVQTLAFFRRRRSFAIATLESHRNPANRILGQNALLLEQRLMQERAILIDPPQGTLLPPRTILECNFKRWAWRSRWGIAFCVLFALIFLVSAGALPRGFRAFLNDPVLASALVALAVGFVGWRVYQFVRIPNLDPVASEGPLQADRQARVLLLAVSAAAALLPAGSLLLSLTGLAHAGAYVSGAVADWLAHGGHLYPALALVAIGAAMRNEAALAGNSLKDEVAAGAEGIARLERQYQKLIVAPGPVGQPAIALDALAELLFKLDAERDMQGRRKRALETSERQAAEMRTADLGRAVEGVIEEFERLRAEFDRTEAEERRRIVAFEKGFNQYLTQIERELDAYDARHGMLGDLWQPDRDLAWALRIAQSADEIARPLLEAFLPDLESLAYEATGEDAGRLGAAIEKIRSFAFQPKPEPEAAPEPAAPAPELSPETLVDLDHVGPVEGVLVEPFRAAPLPSDSEEQGAAHTANLDLDWVPAPEPEPDAEPKAESDVADAREAQKVSQSEENLASSWQALDTLLEEIKRDVKPASEPEQVNLPEPPAAVAPEAAPDIEAVVEPKSVAQPEPEPVAEALVSEPEAPLTAEPEPVADVSLETPTPEAVVEAPVVEPEPQPEPVAAGPLVEPEPYSEPSLEAERAADVAREEALLPEAVMAAPAIVEPELQPEPVAEAPVFVPEPQALPAVEPELIADLAREDAVEPEPLVETSSIEPQPGPVADAPVFVPEPQPEFLAPPVEAPSTFVSHDTFAPAPAVESEPVAAGLEPEGLDVITAAFEPSPEIVAPAPSAEEPPAEPSQTAAEPQWPEPLADAFELEAAASQPPAPDLALPDIDSAKDVAEPAKSSEPEIVLEPAQATLEPDVVPELPRAAVDQIDVAAEPPLPQEQEIPDQAVAAMPGAAAPEAEPTSFEAANLSEPKAEVADTPAEIPATIKAAVAPPEEVAAPVLEEEAPVAAAEARQPAQPVEAVPPVEPAPQPSIDHEEFERSFAMLVQAELDARESLDAERGSRAETQAPPVEDQNEPAQTAEADVPVPIAPEAQPGPVFSAPETAVEQAPAAPNAVAAEWAAIAEAILDDENLEPPPPVPKPETSSRAADVLSTDETAPSTTPELPIAAALPQPEPVVEPAVVEPALVQAESPTPQAESEPAAEAQPATSDIPQTDHFPPAAALVSAPVEPAPAPVVADSRPSKSAAADWASVADADFEPEPAEPQAPASRPQPQSEPVHAPVAPAAPPVAARSTFGRAFGRRAEKPAPAAPADAQPGRTEKAVPIILGAPQQRPAADETALILDDATHAAFAPPQGSAPAAPSHDARNAAPAPAPARVAAARTVPQADSSQGRGIGRGKFAKPVTDKPAEAAPAKSISFRPTKFYGSAKSAVAASGGGKGAAPTSFRSSKFYGSDTGASVDTADRTPSKAEAGSAAGAKSPLTDALTEYFQRSGEEPPPMSTMDSSELQEAMGSGRLDTARRGAAPWSYSGIPRRGDYAIRLKQGAERHVEFVPSNITFGQTPRYYPRRVGVGTAQPYIPVEHLEYFDAGSRSWRAMKQ